MSDQYEKAKAIFLTAVEQHPPDQWRAFLDQACAEDAALRARVDAHRRLGSFHDQGPATFDFTANYPPIAEQPGMVVGRYKLLQEIGEGGMGVVYMAEQQEPVNREVALKIIKPGMDTREVVARFEAERQALALMDHPNIAHVLDGGAAESGRPYFVMELVHGIPITDYCDQNDLAIRDRLELFVSLCQAVQHAHQKGIIHRDIKPSNILVTLHDGAPVPKIVDFGVAKAIDRRLTEKTAFTRYGQMIGTPLYMSPEQAEMSRLGVDTRTDIYSLGVVLYELLTGATPFDKARFREAGYDEICSIIRQEEPPKPSTKISTLGEAATTISAHRKTEPGKLRSLLRGELDWIVMKALEKDRTRRYETADSFARDIQRYLRDEPVEACPPSRLYKLRKFARRNKTAILAAALVFLALMSGLGVAAWQAVRATDARDVAQQQRGEAQRQRDRADQLRQAEQRRREEAEEQRREADRQRKLAEENFRRAREAVDKYLTKVSETELLNVSGLQPLRKDLLELALEYYKGFIAERSDDPSLQADLAAAHYRVGEIESEIGSKEEAFKAHRRALEIRKKLVAAKPDSADYRIDLARSFRSLATLHTQAANHQDGLPFCQQAISIGRQLVAESPGNSAYRADLAGACALLSYFCSTRREHLAACQEAARICEQLVNDDPKNLKFSFDFASSLVELGGSQWYSKNRVESLACFEKAIEILEKLRQREPSIAKYGSMLARCYTGVGANKDRDEALEWHEKAIAIHEQLVQQNPSVSEYQHLLVQGLVNVGRLLWTAGKTEEALAHLARAFEIRLQLVKNNPTAYYLGQFVKLCSTWNELADPSAASETNNKMLAYYREAITLIKGMSVDKAASQPQPSRAANAIEGDPATRSQIEVCRGALSAVYCRLGQLQAKLHKKDDALASLEESFKIRDELLEKHPSVFKGQEGMREMFFSSRIDLLACLEKWDEALREYDRWLEAEPDSSKAHTQRGVVLSKLGRHDDALREWAKAIELDPNDEKNCRTSCHSNRITLFARLEKWDEALQEYDKWLEVHPDWPGIYTRRGVTLSKLGRNGEALRDWAKAIELDPDNAKGCRSASHGNRIGVYADTEQWGKVLAECEHALKMKTSPNEAWLRYVRAMVHVHLGRSDDYRTACAAMLERFRDSDDAEVADWTAWTCSLAPDAVADPSILLALARRAAEKDPKSLSYLKTVGAALYRAGQFEEAARRFEQVDALAKSADSDERFSPAYGWYFLAMARHRLGNKEEATKWLSKANQSTGRALEEHNRQGGERLSWSRRVTLEVLRGEAESLILGDEGKQATNPP